VAVEPFRAFAYLDWDCAAEREREREREREMRLPLDLRGRGSLVKVRTQGSRAGDGRRGAWNGRE
jgi:hypothetical protein